MMTGRETRQAQKDCIFCAIIAGDAPSRIVFQTPELVCFFPLEPELFAHTLIVPKAHYEDIRDTPASFGAYVFEASQFLASHYRNTLGATGFNLMNASGRDAEQSVFHLHFHFLPRFPDDKLNTWPKLPSFDVDLDQLLNKVKLD
jgi:histidine triad (HIT) family protein